MRKHENSLNELEKRENANPLLKRSENEQSGSEKCAEIESVKKNRTRRAGTRDTVLRKHENSLNEFRKRLKDIESA